MTSRQIYEAILIELNKNNAPSLRLHEFNYLFNKAVNEFVDELYQSYDTNQLATDSLRVLQSEAFLTPHQVVITYPHSRNKAIEITKGRENGIDTATRKLTNDNISSKSATYEVFMPEDYLHILNCTCIYFLNKSNKCYDAGDYLEVPATKLTADTWSTIIADVYNRPSPLKPYYYIHNRNSQETLPTNPVNSKQTKGNDLGIRFRALYYNERPTAQSPELYSPDNINWFTDWEFTKPAESNIKNFDPALIHIQSDTEVLEPFSRTVNLSGYDVSTVEKPAYLRCSNPQKVRMEIRYGKDNSVYELVEVRIDYVKSPQFIRLTQEQIDLTDDTSQIMEFPDYICQKIINKLVALLLERSSDPRLTTNVQINRTMVSPAQPQAQQS